MVVLATYIQSPVSVLTIPVRGRDSKLATRRRGRGRLLADIKICRRWSFHFVANWTSQNIWNHGVHAFHPEFLVLRASWIVSQIWLTLQALLRRVDYNRPGSCNPVFPLYTFANIANTRRLAWPGMRHTITVLWTPVSSHYYNIAIWVGQCQTGQAWSLQAQSLATLLQGGTRQLLPTDGKIEDDHCFPTNIVLLIQLT